MSIDFKSSLFLKPIPFFFAVITATLFPAIITLIAIRWEIVPGFTYPLGKIIMLAIPVIWWRISGFGAREMIERSGLCDKKWWLGLPHGLVIGGAVALFYYGVLCGRLPNAGLMGKINSLGLEKTWTLVIIGLSLVNSAAEEYYWRSFLYPVFAEKTNPTFAVFLNGSLFTLHHLIVLTVYFPIGYAITFAFGTGIGGALWAELRRRRISILACWISHMIVDFTAMMIGCVSVVGLKL